MGEWKEIYVECGVETRWRCGRKDCIDYCHFHRSESTKSFWIAGVNAMSDDNGIVLKGTH